MGSGGSALSLAFAAGLAAANGFGATTAPAFVAGGAGVLPSTGSAIFPLLDLSISIINRDYRRTKFLRTVFRYNFLYFRNPLPVKAKSDFGSYLCTCFGSHPHRTYSTEWGQRLPRRWVSQGKPKRCHSKCGITAGRGAQFSRRMWRAQLIRWLLRPRAAGAAMQSEV